jgi:hypothetical protein
MAMGSVKRATSVSCNFNDRGSPGAEAVVVVGGFVVVGLVVLRATVVRVVGVVLPPLVVGAAVAGGTVVATTVVGGRVVVAAIVVVGSCVVTSSVMVVVSVETGCEVSPDEPVSSPHEAVTSASPRNMLDHLGRDHRCNRVVSVIGAS